MTEASTAVTGITFEMADDGKLYIKLQLLREGAHEERLLEIAKGALQFILSEYDVFAMKAFNESLKTPKAYDA